MSPLYFMKDFDLEIIHVAIEGITLEELWSLISNQHTTAKKIYVKSTMTHSMLTNLAMEDLRNHIKPMLQVKTIDLRFATFTNRDMQLINLMFPSVQFLKISVGITHRSAIPDALIEVGRLTELAIDTFSVYSHQLVEFELGELDLPTEAFLKAISRSRAFRVRYIVINTNSNTQSTTNHGFSIYSNDKEWGAKAPTLDLNVKLGLLTDASSDCLVSLLLQFEGLITLSIYGDQNAHHTREQKILTKLASYALAASQTLEYLVLSHLSLTSLPAVNEGSIKRRMKLMELMDCLLPPDFLLQLSQRINYLEALINMPFTKFDQVDLTGLESPHIFKLCLDSRILYYHVDSDYNTTMINADRHVQLRAIEPEFVAQCATLKLLQTQNCETYID
ncbi:hypothetical protein MBANPS3_005358 [Mucor bainieri]